jgi:hypothetical protein
LARNAAGADHPFSVAREAGRTSIWTWIGSFLKE